MAFKNGDKYVLVCYEKHGDFFYDATTPEELDESAFAILKLRFDEGYWYSKPENLFDPDSKWRSNVHISKIIDGWYDLPDKDAKQAAVKNLLDEYDRLYGDDEEVLNLKKVKVTKAVKDWNQENNYRKWYKNLLEVIETEDKSRAWGILQDRSGHEYERVELEPLRRGVDG